MIKIYGIANCDTMKKAMTWLNKNKLIYEFHDYKKWGVPEKELRLWVKNAGWDVVLNKRSVTWKGLDDKIKNGLNDFSAIQIMLENHSSIKRPVLVNGETLIIGFKESEYQTLLR